MCGSRGSDRFDTASKVWSSEVEFPPDVNEAVAVDAKAVDVVAVDSCEADVETEMEVVAERGPESDEVKEATAVAAEGSRPRLKAAKGCTDCAARHATFEIPG